MGILVDNVGRFLANHVDVRDDEHAGNVGENRRINDAQAGDAAHAKSAVHDGESIVAAPILRVPQA